MNIETLKELMEDALKDVNAPIGVKTEHRGGLRRLNANSIPIAALALALHEENRELKIKIVGYELMGYGDAMKNLSEK